MLDEHLLGMTQHSPEESVFALDRAGLEHPSVTLWSVDDGDIVAGFGALKELDSRHGEVKSMRTTAAMLGRGVAAALLQFIIDEAVRRGYDRLSLETGSGRAFEPAYRLYRKFGFVDCGPFADYEANAFSRFMRLTIRPPVLPSS